MRHPTISVALRIAGGIVAVLGFIAGCGLFYWWISGRYSFLEVGVTSLMMMWLSYRFGRYALGSPARIDRVPPES